MRDWPDEKLLLETAAARRAAHASPMQPYRLDADGHRWVDLSEEGGWNTCSDKWVELANEVDGRGIPQPSLDHGL